MATQNNSIETEFKLSHETKKSTLIRFLSVLSILVLYLVFVSVKFGLKDGFFVTAVTWSFFVFCTPIADAGFLLDFPIRLITKIRMVYSEIVVWTIAALLNIYAINYAASTYGKTEILTLFEHVLKTPWPFWGIILISAIGTFMSVYFGDEMIDVVKHKDRKQFIKHGGKYRLVLLVFVVLAIIFLYIYLIEQLGLNIPLL